MLLLLFVVGIVVIVDVLAVVVTADVVIAVANVVIVAIVAFVVLFVCYCYCYYFVVVDLVMIVITGVFMWPGHRHSGSLIFIVHHGGHRNCAHSYHCTMLMFQQSVRREVYEGRWSSPCSFDCFGNCEGQCQLAGALLCSKAHVPSSIVKCERSAYMLQRMPRPRGGC